MATIIETVRSYPALADVGSALVDKILVDRGISGDTSYSSAVKKNTELAAADLMVEVANSPDFSEGDLSMKYKPAALLNRAKEIYKEHGDPKALTVFKQPSVGNASNLW